MFQTVGQHTQRERLGFCQRIVLRFAISHAPGQFHDFSNPATIRLTVEFDFQIHNRKLNQRLVPV